MDVSTLLEQLNAEFQRAGLQRQRRRGEAHNIFRILNIQRNEVLVCRFLGYLLDPSGSHGRGSAPLRGFLEEIGAHGDFTEEAYRRAAVKLEEHTDTDRRVDIAVYIADEVIPIEVKIGASDEKAQLYDYYKYYTDVRRIKVNRIYYLTPNGTAPSDKSISAEDGSVCLRPGQYKTISFRKHIRRWLADLPSENDPNHLIAQFKEVITDMCREYDNSEKLLELLELGPGTTRPSEYLELLSVLLENGSFIWEKLRNQYLLNTLALGSLADEYILTDPDAEDLKKDLYCLLALKQKSDHKTVAWICVETNLYLVIDRDPGEHAKWKAGNNCRDYFWRYLNPDGSCNAFPLRSPNTSVSKQDKIDLNGILRSVLKN